jgi:hypothetical protein
MDGKITGDKNEYFSFGENLPNREKDRLNFILNSVP